MPDGDRQDAWKPLDPLKFQDPVTTIDGSTRAFVALDKLRTVWFNTGTLCNIACEDCYIESSPRNDRLAYLTLNDVRSYLDEIVSENLPVEEIGFTGGEPFMNPEFIDMLDATLDAGFRALVLTNAMKPMHLKKSALSELHSRFDAALVLRVSIDHPTREKHEELRGEGSWAAMREGVHWLSENGISIHVAGRTRWHEPEREAREAYARLFQEWGLSVDALSPAELILFPEMDPRQDVPEITTACWDILGVSPGAMMCASSRMIIKRRSSPSPSVVACTLLPYDAQFELGTTLTDASGLVQLNHPHCARFCVLGGGACSVADN